VPRRKEDPHYAEYLEYTRDLFRAYMRKYVDAIHAFDPTFQITSNWSYSSHMPEPVQNNVDFLSGDVTPQDGVYRSAFEARAMAPQGKPWDLMSWGFSWNGARMPMSNKSAVQLKQEAAQVIAMGGGIQVYYPQNRDLSLKPWVAEALSEISAFCRERQSFCHKAKAIPQVALLFPAKTYRRQASSPFPGAHGKLPATLYALLDNQLPVELLMEHHLQGRMRDYPLIVVPECSALDPGVLAELKAYVQEGGRLLLIGSETAGLFAGELGLRSSKRVEDRLAFVSAAGRLGGIRTAILEATTASDTRTLTTFFKSNDYADADSLPATLVRNLGKGRIAAVLFDAGSAYSEYKTPVIRDLLAETVTALAPDRKVEVSGSHLVHVALNTLKGRTLVNLVNVPGEHTNRAAIGYDPLPPLTDIAVTIPGRPKKILLQPGSRELTMRYKDGKTSVNVPKVEIHSILEIFE